MKFLPEFKNYLFSQKDPSSKVTVKNYISDIVRFVRWFEKRFNSSFSPESVTPQVIEQFKQSNNLAMSSIDRNLSSLRKFFNFLVLEGVISESPLKQSNNETIEQSDPYKLKAFKDYLYVYNASRLTIKNYLMDVKGFFKWLEEVSKANDAWDIKEKDILSKIDNYLIEEYKRRLPYSPRTMNRKLSSLRKYLKWAKEEGLITQGENIFQGVTRGQGARQRGDFRSVVSEGKETRKSSTDGRIVQASGPQNSYSKFPPLRLVQKTIRGLVLLPELVLIAPLASFVRGIGYLKWKISGKPVIEKVKQSKSIRPVRNFPKETFAPFAVSITHFPFHRKLLFHLTHTRPNWYKRYHTYSFTHYLHLALLIVFMSIFGFNIYQNIIQRPNTGVLGVALPLNPPNPRVLSFQGRLTDSSNNPITASTNLRFIIYDDISASSSALKWQEVDTVTPDSDGVFSVLLGKNTALTQDLFAQHAGLWLGVTVGQTAELTPRQQLATVAFAENTETLQGLPPITQSGAATSNVVLALDSSGNLTIGGSATPTFQATGGKFTVSGNVLALTTTAGSKSNVQIAPDGRSFIDLQKPLQNSTKNNNISSALGAVEVDSLLAVLATSSGQSAFTVNQNGAGPIISASNSGLPKFTVDNSGNTTIAGGNFSQTGSGTFSTGTGTVSLNGDSTIASGKNFTVTLGNTSLTSSTATSNALSLTDTALTSGTGFAKTFTSNAGNGQTTIGESIALTDSTTAGGGYTGLSISTSGSGSGSGNKYLLDLNPGTNKDVVFDSAGAFRPTVAVSSNTNTIGSASFYWKNGFFDQITANTLSGTVAGGSTSSTTWTIGSTQTGDVNEALIFQRNSGSGNATLQWNAGSGDLRYLTANYPLNTTYTVNNTSIGTTIDLLSANLTNNTTSGTQRLLSLTNTGTGTTANGIYINNSGTGSTGVEIAGTWGTGLLTNNNTINAGTGAITSGAITTSGNFSQTGSTTFSTGTGNVSLNGNVLIAANQTVQLSSGTGTITQNYSNNTGTGTTLNITDSASSGTTTVNGLGVALVGTANATGANTLNALNFSNVTAQTNNTYNALNLGTGYTNFITSGTVNLTAAGALSGLTTVSASGSVSTTGTGTITSAGLLTASNGLTLTTGALNLTATSGSTSITSYGTTSITSTTTSGNINTLADASLNTTGANLLNLTFTNANSGVTSTTINGVSITPTGTTNANANANTLNAINFPNVTAIANNTFNGLNFGTGYNNLVNSANWTVTAAGAETLGSNLSIGTNPASSGAIRLANNSYIIERNAANNGDITLARVDTGNNVQIGDTAANLSQIAAIYANGTESFWASTQGVMRWGGGSGASGFSTNSGAALFTMGPLNLQWATDNTYNIGAGAANRPHNVYVGGLLRVSGGGSDNTIYLDGPGPVITGHNDNSAGRTWAVGSGGTGNNDLYFINDTANNDIFRTNGIDAMRIDPNQHVSFGPNIGSAGTGEGFLATFPATSFSGGAQRGFDFQPTFSSAATTTGEALRISYGTQGASFTMGTLYGLNLASPSLGTGSLISNWYGEYIAAPNFTSHTTGTTAAYGLYVEGPPNCNNCTGIYIGGPSSGAGTSGGFSLSVCGNSLTVGCNIGIGTTNTGVSNGQVGGELAIANSNNPGGIGAVAGQGILYVNTGALKYQGPTTLTQLAAADYAEAMPFTGDLDQAEVVSTSSVSKTNSDIYNNFYITQTSQGYDPKLIGVVSSTSPETNNTTRMVALVGRVPVKVTSENGVVKSGDYLTSSATKPGYAMKATKAGRVIGVALNDFEVDSCGTSSSNFGLIDSSSCIGKVLVFVNATYHDPQPAIVKTADQLAQFTIEKATGLVSNTLEGAYIVKDEVGNVVSRSEVLASAVIGTLRSGLIETKDLIADNINVNNKIISPIAEISTVRTDTISPLSSNKVVVKLTPPQSEVGGKKVGVGTESAKFEVQNASGSAVASITDKGDASFSGRLNSKELNTEEATISGTLKAKNIIADNIDSQILNLRSSISGLVSSISGTLNTKYQIPNTDAINIASYSAQLASVDTIQAQVGTFMQGLFAVGPSSFSDASVFGQLSVGGNLVLAQNSINVLGTDLKLQPLGQGGILLGKAVYIDANGDLSVSGNAKFNGTLFANVISPIPGNDLVFKLLNKNATESANFTIQNASGSAVARIDQNGDATFRKLNLSLVSPAFALSSNEVIATGSAGIATISAQFKELTVDNKLVTEKSLIYITPVGTPSAQTPFLLRQVSGESFTVGVEQQTETKIPFNWLIIN